MDLYVRNDGTLALRQAPGQAFRASGSPDNTPMYAQGGLFALCGLDPQVVAAIINPIGVERILRWEGTDEMNPIYGALVDIQSSGHGQSSGCADCGKPSFKEAELTARFGRYCQQTPEHQADQIGRRMNQGVQNIQLFGNVTDPAGNILFGSGQTVTDRFMLDLVGVAYGLRRYVGEEIWTGDGTKDGGLEHMIGLELLVNTGQREAFNHTLVPALDSQVLDYESNIVGADGSPSIRAYIRAVINSIRYRISAMDLDPNATEMYIVMREQIWEGVSAAVACEYGISCETGATARQDAREVARYLDRIRADHVLPIDGRDYPVIIDNQIPLSYSAYGNTTKHCSDIYVLTTRLENYEPLYGQYQNFNTTAGNAIAWMKRQFGNIPISITDGGKFMHAYTTSGGFCFDVRTLVRPRLVCKMPQVQGRISNVCYVPLGNYPDVTGSGGLYEFEGGLYEKPYLGLYDQGYDNRNPEQ